MLTTGFYAFLAYLKKAWEWCKPHLIAMLLTAVASYALFSLFKSGNGAIAARFDSIERHNAEELKKINKIQEDDRKAHEENIQHLQQQLKEVQEKHDAAIKKLEEQKAKETSTLIRVYGGDPKGMAQQVSSATGFPVYKGK